MKVLVLHTLPPDAAAPGRTTGEFDLSDATANIASVLPGSIVAGVRGEASELLEQLRTHAPDVVFNACEAPLGRPDLEAHVAALLEWVGVPFTGSGSETLALCRHKNRTNAVLAAAGLPVPRLNGFPRMVKPEDEDGSAGIHLGSICHSDADVVRETARLGGPVIVEEFLPGREFVVSLWGPDHRPDHYAIGETRYINGLPLLTYAAKWEVDSADFANSPLTYELDLDDDQRESILWAARGAWTAVRVRGYMRVDIRLDEAGAPRIIDVNPNPELGPGVGICRAVAEAGWTWEQFVRAEIEWALQ